MAEKRDKVEITNETTNQSVQTNTDKVESSKTDVARRENHSPFFMNFEPRNLFTSNPFEMMNRFSEEMDRMFAESGFGLEKVEPSAWRPAVEVFDKDGKLFVRAELPGLNKEDIKVEVTDKALLIRGERKHETRKEEKNYYRSEVSYGSFYRAIPLPKNVNTDEVEAGFKDGILEITVPLPTAAQNRREIPIGKQNDLTQKETTQQKAAQSATAKK